VERMGKQRAKCDKRGRIGPFCANMVRRTFSCCRTGALTAFSFAVAQ
jgi:hypothetical protein